jgi:hypothetical protein
MSENTKKLLDFNSKYNGKFILGDKVKTIRENLPAFKGFIIDYLIHPSGSTPLYYVYDVSNGLETFREDELDFTFVKDRKYQAKYGTTVFKNKRSATKILDIQGNYIHKHNAIWASFNRRRGFINTDEFYNNDKYFSTKTRISTAFGIVYEETTFEELRDSVKVDYITGSRFDSKRSKPHPIIEISRNNEIKIHYTILNTSNYPYIILDTLPPNTITSLTNGEFSFLNDVFGNKLVAVVSVKNLLENGYVESLKNGYFFIKDAKGKMSSTYNRYFGYQEFRNNCMDKIGSKSASFIGTEGLKYTFGIEIEMQQCYIPTYLRPQLNINCVRDGSINNRQGDRNGGPEFTSGVLQGDSGLIHLNKICNEITKRGVLDKSCGLHTHIGGASFSEKFLVMSYILGLKLEKEFFDLVPPSRRGSVYCSKLKDLNFNFKKLEGEDDFRTRCGNYYNELFKYLCGKYPDNNHNKFTNHPNGRTCGYNHSSPRYNWLNFVPAVFDTKGVKDSWTLEFRLHSGTSNFNKIKNWTKICMAFVNFADNHSDDILNNCVTINGKKLPLTLTNIVTKIYPKTGSKLVAYMEDRKSKFESSEEYETLEYSENHKGVEEYNDIKQALV